MNKRYTSTLPAQTLDNAAPAARQLLETAKAKLGFIPNMYGSMANSPGLLSTYMTGYNHFRQDSGFSPQEQEVVFLTISRANACDYCVAAHSLLADQMTKVPVAVTNAIRDFGQIPDPKLAALSQFTDVIVASRGLPSEDDVKAFLGAGFSEQQVLEVVLAVAVKTLSNYVNHLFQTPLDPMFAARAWVAPAAATECNGGCRRG